ncbi:hypothetical protein GCM10022246_15980 [Pedobacter ginsengiterrae]|uniref:DUF350 domain-containing protein n=1 Tax=Pedobacter ginsengiterrae TaxID=871696 RepID=A0ABP7PCV0_9SPHI|nr:DUF350 domain-containing protein [Pedobacter aquatilis]
MEIEPTLVTSTDFIINKNNMSLNELISMKYIIASLVYSVIGIIVLFLAFWVIEKITPENLWKEILEKQNMALAVVFAAFIIAIALIISSAIHS